MNQAVKAAKKPAKSKQAIAKDAQGFDPKPTPQTCGNCHHLATEASLAAWMVRENAERAAAGRRAIYDRSDERVISMKCSLGGFAVKKMATCSQFKPKDSA